MIKNKIYEYLKKYLDAYLYDFDKNQLEMSYLSGSINLQDLNLKQDMANKLIDSFGIPLQLKAGFIGKVKVSFSLLSFWSSPLEINIDDMHLVLGPSTFFRSNDESYIEETPEDILNMSYDSTNAFNVFEHEMKIKANTIGASLDILDQNTNADLKSVENARYIASVDQLKERLLEEEKQVQNVRLIFKNLKLKINRLHIRFEDDYYSQYLNKKFAFGISIEEIDVQSSNQQWLFNSAKSYINNKHQDSFNQRTNQTNIQQNYQNNQFELVNIDPQTYPEIHKDHANLLIKEGVAYGIQIYFEENCKVLIPTEKLEHAINTGNPKQIYSQVDQNQIKNYLNILFYQQPHQNSDYNHSHNPFVVIEKFNLQCHIFSYRWVEFPKLFGFLNQNLNQKGEGLDKTPRLNDKIGDLLGKNQKNKINLVQIYKEIQEEQFQFFRNEFSLKFCLVPESVNIAVNITPALLESLKSVNEFIENFYLAQDLKQYRPQRRPITASQTAHMTQVQMQNTNFKRKKRNIVRDWLYFIVWYVRLRKILEKHKESSANISVNQLLKGFPSVQIPNDSVIKSPVQDPTQLSKLEITTNIGRIQVKIFENQAQMSEYYQIINQGSQQQNNKQRQKQQVANQNQRMQRLAPISFTFAGVQSQYIQQLQNSLIIKDFMLKGLDIYMSRIQVLQDWPSEVNRSNTFANNIGFASPKIGAFHGNASQTQTNLFNSSLNIARQESQRRNVIVNGGSYKDRMNNNLFYQHKQSATNVVLGHNQYNTTNINNIDDTEEGPLNAKSHINDYSFNNSHMTALDHPFNQTNKTYLIDEQLHQQQPQSIWKQLFKAIKDLFNMNSNPNKLSQHDFTQFDQNDNYIHGANPQNVQLRQSVHRQVGIMQFDQVNGKESPAKVRTSLPFNAQLEITKIGTQSSQKGKFTPTKHNNYSRQVQQNYKLNANHLNIERQMQSSSRIKNQDMSFSQNGQIISNFSNLQQKSTFNKNIARHLCHKFINNKISTDVYEVIQYPIMKTQNFQQFQHENKYLILMNYKIQKQQYLQMQALVDKQIEFNYCTQDILEVLFKNNKGIIQQYSRLIQQMMPDKQSPSILDFKPLWLIRRSIIQQQKQFLEKQRIQINKQSTNNLKLRNITHTKKRSLGIIETNNDGGENINDDDGELAKTLSFIKCKPSLIKSNNSQPNNHLNSQRNVQSFRIKSSLEDNRDDCDLLDQDKLLAPYNDKYFNEALKTFERNLVGNRQKNEDNLIIDIQIEFMHPIQLQFLTNEPIKQTDLPSQNYMMVARMSIQPQSIQLLRSQMLSSFRGFGIEFESTNRIKVLQLFSRQIYSSIMSFYQNPIVFQNLRGGFIYQKIRQVIREKIVERKQSTNNIKFKNLDAGSQLIDNVLFLKSPRTDQNQNKLDLANPTGLNKQLTSKVSYSVSLQNAAKINSLNIPVLQQANSKAQQIGGGVVGASGAGAKRGDIDDHDLIDIGDDDESDDPPQ